MPDAPGRPLSYLATLDVAQVKGLAGKRSEKLAEAGIETVADLLMHAPRRYVDRSRTVPLAEVPLGEEVTVFGTVKKVSMRRARGKLVIVDATIFDGDTYLFAVWFNQAFRARQLTEGAEVAFSGVAERYRGKLQMKSPDVDVLDKPGESLITGRVVPVHPTIGGVGPGYLRRAIHNALMRAQPIHETLPADILDERKLVSRTQAFADLHFPEELEAAAAARRRLAYDEFFRLELALAMRKHRQIEEEQGFEHEDELGLAAAFVAGLPFQLTGAQERVLADIEADLRTPHPMHRLLQGEVGSGKTAVAVAALLRAVGDARQGAVMAPTEVLAEQHFLSITDLLAGSGMAPPEEGDGADLGMGSLFAEDTEHPSVRLALLTSNNAEVNFRPRGSVSRDDVLAWIAGGDIHIVVGTHALIQEGVHFARLGIAVVDEQHRFGVHQRVQLREKGDEAQPDLLIMTATPIPRTLSMTLYGDLDVSILDEMPPGRTPVKTIALGKGAADWARVYELIRQAVGAGRQAFVVCPLVEDSAKVYAASATAEHERLQGELDDLRVGLIHGQLRPADKEAVMTSFRNRELDVLVATTVIEVGIDIPNATVMVIEDADRFGLSQLHQLRGRVGRGEHPATCVLMAEPTTTEGERRIAAMVETTDGFRLAEEDLAIRGQGTVFGARQAGVGDLRIGDILRDTEELIAARSDAFGLVAADHRLDDHPDLAEEVRRLLGESVEWLFLS